MTHHVVVPRVPALDGIRGLAVAAVLAFHAGATWMTGGFLGVSSFFTLSGFLITSLLLAEREQTGGVALRAFWGRRARRLLPASLVCLLGVLAYGLAVADPTALDRLRGDVLAALGQVANWRFVLDQRDYGDLFVEPSPVLHFWSLAIEEQAYVVLPLVVALLTARLGWGRRGVAVVASLGAAASVAALVTVGSTDTTQAYYGTHTRAAELLWGVAAAAVIGLGRDLPRRARLPLAVASLGSVAALGALWATAAVDDTWVYRWALPLHPLLTLAVILAVVHGAGPLGRALAVEPLAALGRISYGVYLYHWPIFLWLSPARTGLDGWALTGLRLGATLAAATLSYHLLEWPVRRWRSGSLPRLALPAAMAVGAIVAGSAGLANVAEPPPVWLTAGTAPAPDVQPPPPPAPPGTAAPGAPDAVAADDVPRRGEGGVTPAARPRLESPLRVLVVGDSVAASIGVGLEEWGTQTGHLVVWNTGTPGCGLVRGGDVRAAGREGPSLPGCDAWPTHFADRIEQFRPDLVVVMAGAWDAADHRLEGEDVWRAPGDDVLDARLRSEMDQAVEVLSAGGATVVWLSHPYISLAEYPGVDATRVRSEEIPERMDVLNALVRSVSAEHDEAEVLDLQGWLAGTDGGEMDRALRPDGVHFGWEGTAQAAAWLGPRLVDLAGYDLPGDGTSGAAASEPGGSSGSVEASVGAGTPRASSGSAVAS